MGNEYMKAKIAMEELKGYLCNGESMYWGGGEFEGNY
jgi:hypothetical protein